MRDHVPAAAAALDGSIPADHPSRSGDLAEREALRDALHAAARHVGTTVGDRLRAADAVTRLPSRERWGDPPPR